MSYAVDERIDEFAKAFVAILRRMLGERYNHLDKNETKGKEGSHAKRFADR